MILNLHLHLHMHTICVYVFLCVFHTLASFRHMSTCTTLSNVCSRFYSPPSPALSGSSFARSFAILVCCLHSWLHLVSNIAELKCLPVGCTQLVQMSWGLGSNQSNVVCHRKEQIQCNSQMAKRTSIAFRCLALKGYENTYIFRLCLHIQVYVSVSLHSLLELPAAGGAVNGAKYVCCIFNQWLTFTMLQVAVAFIANDF